MLLYFANGGDDTTGNGTQAAPYKTVTKANALLAAWTSGAFDGLSFLGGQEFTDAALTVPAVAGTLAAPFKITSHGTGRAKLKRITGSAAASTITGASYVTLENISLESVTGSGVASNQNCITLSGCTEVVFDRVDTLGGEAGIASNTSTFSARQTTIRYPWLTGILNTRNAQILEDVEVNGAGHDPLGNVNGAAAYGLAATSHSSAAFLGNRVRLLRCKSAIHNASGGTSRLRRAWIRTELPTQITQIVSDNASTTEFYDSIMRLDADDGATPYFGFSINSSGGTIRFYNCTLRATTAFAVLGTVALTGNTVNAYNTIFSSTLTTLSALLYLATGSTRVFDRCRFESVYAASSAAFAVDSVSLNKTMAQWLALGFVTNSTSGAPGFANDALLGPDFARLASSSPLLGAGADLLATYAAQGFPTADYFGLPRLSGYWSIGAADYTVATRQSFSEGAGLAALDGAVDYDCLASLRDVPAFGNFPAVDHELTAKVRFEAGTTRVGIWLLGGRVGTETVPPDNPLSSRIYQHTFDPGSVVALTAGGRWDIGATPGNDDPRRVVFEIKRVGTTWELSINGSASGAMGGSFSATTNGAAALLGLAVNKEITLTLKVLFKGRVSGPAGRSDYRFDFLGYVGDQLGLSIVGAILPQGWIEGFGIPDANGPSSWAGIIGKRTGSSNAAVNWLSFGGLVTGAVSAISVPAASLGETRPKDYSAARHHVPNRLSNGGFTSFPRTLAVQTFANAIETIDPNYVAPSAELPVHAIFLLDASGSMRHGSRRAAVKHMLQKFLETCPVDGQVIFTVIRCWGTTQADYWVPTQVITPTAQAALITFVQSFDVHDDPGWPAGVQFATAAFTDGYVDTAGAHTVGARKIMFVVSDESGYGQTPPELAIRDALHAVPGLSEVSVFSVKDPINLLVSQFEPLLFPTAIPANTPRDSGLSTDTALPSSVVIPHTTGCIGLSVASLKKPSLTPTQGLTGLPAADQIGIDAATETIRWIDDYLATFSAPPAPPTVFRNAYEAWPAIDASYAFDVRAGVVETSLGAWRVTGQASIEVRPRDRNDAVIHSRDGGNVIRVTLSAKGTLELRQAIADPRPFREDYITVAYSGAKGAGSPRVGTVVIQDGEETECDVTYGGFMGIHSRRVSRSVAVRRGVKELVVAIRIKGNAGESVLLSGVAAAQGRTEFDLPYSEAMADIALPRGCVFMYAGESCPPGFRAVPGMDGRNAYAFTGDPNFYRREFASALAAAPARTGPLVEVVLLVDGSATQSASAARSSVLAWLTEMVNTTLPKSGQVRLSIVFTNAGFPGYILLHPTTLTVASAASECAAALNALNDPILPPNFAPPSGDRMSQGFDAMLPLLQNSTAPVKVVFYNTDSSFDHAGAAVTASFSAITAVPGLVEVSAVAIGSSRAAVLASGGESLIYPAPSSEPPGILFEANGGAPGFALPGTFAGQPYQAGAYAAEVFGRRVRQQISFITSTDQQTFEGGIATNLGGQEFHDHANGTQFGSNIDEPDGFEDPTDDPITTAVPLPTQDTAVIKPYPYHAIPSQTRPEDPPVYAIGPLHTHSLDTKMRAMPPSFPVLFCEKL